MNRTMIIAYTNPEVIKMAKQGMKRPDYTHIKPKNSNLSVPEIQGKAKSGKVRANPIIAGTSGSSQKVWHDKYYLNRDN